MYSSVLTSEIALSPPSSLPLVPVSTPCLPINVDCKWWEHYKEYGPVTGIV